MDTQESENVVNAIPKFCPICANLMIKGYIDGIYCWICEECGYIEPIM